MDKINKINYFMNNNKMVIYSLFILFYIPIISKIENFPKNEISSSYITLRIKGKGIKKIYNSFPFPQCLPINPDPDEIYINNTKQNSIFSEYNFLEENNEIILLWNESLTTCNCLFMKCNDVNEVDFSHFDTSQVTAMMGIFYECRGLKSLDLSNFDTSKVTDMKWMFLRCEFLKYVNLSSFNTSKVKYIANMFEGCSSLVTLDLSNFDTSEVVDMCFMFASCSSLVSLNLSNFDTAKVTNMAGMFGECSSLVWLDISHFDTSRVKGFDQMFFNCTLLPSLNIFNFDTSNVTNMFAMFYSCKSLTSLDISGFNTSNVDNMEYMFGRCINLEYINFKNANIKESAKLNNIFSETALNLVVCTTDLILISKVNDNECALVDCSDNSKKNRKKIDVNANNCVENCNSNTFEYDSKCYNDCPNGSYRSIYFDSDNNYYNNCINSINGYYLDENDLFYKKCYYTCKTCDKKEMIFIIIV